MANTKKSTKNKKKTTTKRGYYEEPEQFPARAEDNSARILVGIFLILLGILAVLSIFYNDGKFLNGITNVLLGLFGWGYWLFGFCMIYIGCLLVFVKNKAVGFQIICLSLLPIFFSSIISMFSVDLSIKRNLSDLYQLGILGKSGGVISGSFADMLFSYIGKVGSIVLLIIISIVLLFGALGADASLFGSLRKSGSDADGDNSNSIFASRPSMTNMIESETDTPKDYSFKIPALFGGSNKSAAPTYTTNAGTGRASDYNVPLGDENDNVKVASKPRKKSTSSKDISLQPAGNKIPITVEKGLAPVVQTASTIDDIKNPEKITKEDIEKETAKVAKDISNSAETVEYVFPEINLLKQSKSNGNDSQDVLYATQERLESTLHSFGIMSNVVKITPGPTVTRFDIELEQGVKLSKVTNLAGDLALSLGVLNVRVAPIPDEISTVGIEVPNKIVNNVSLREIIESSNFVKSSGKLTFAVGKDIGGHAIVGDISKLPHLLIAGTTGSGKSVCMNSLIISLLYKSKPDEVKFIMIDPKMVELGIYNSIPHLYVPVVTEPKKAAGALQWAVVEMLKRYRLFSEAGVRDLETYNKYCKNNDEQTLPQVVILIDELADLMMAASKEVEESICRVAQMGRAAGMHLVIATQRPSADVITGLMKANIPSRIAFAVSSAMESRIIMDQSGAEKLIGHGDMLFSPLGSGKPLRVQGCYVSDNEREAIVNFIKKNSSYSTETPSDLQEAINKGVDSNDTASQTESDSVNGDYDEMLPKAVDVVLDMKSCSVSMLQRRLKLGYSRAARVVDQMEELGIVGPYEGAKPRTVPISREEWNELKIKLGYASDDDSIYNSQISDDSQLTQDIFGTDTDDEDQ